MSDTALLSVADGVTLADGAINTALALPGTVEVVLPPGRYLLGDQVVLAPRVRLRGAGPVGWGGASEWNRIDLL